MLVSQLEFSAKSITHDGKLGEVNEQHFIALLKEYLPKRYSVDSAIVVDSLGATSDQIDVVIFDNQYTPTLLDQRDHRYVPAEAVYAVIEVKSRMNSANIQYAAKKAESVRALNRTSGLITHAAGDPVKKAPIPITAGVVAATSVFKNGLVGTNASRMLAGLNSDQFLDFGLIAEGGCFDFFDGSYSVGPDDNSLAYLLFRLLGKLNSVGTVPAVDWSKYAAIFR